MIEESCNKTGGLIVLKNDQIGNLTDEDLIYYCQEFKCIVQCEIFNVCTWYEKAIKKLAKKRNAMQPLNHVLLNKQLENKAGKIYNKYFEAKRRKFLRHQHVRKYTAHLENIKLLLRNKNTGQISKSKNKFQADGKYISDSMIGNLSYVIFKSQVKSQSISNTANLSIFDIFNHAVTSTQQTQE